MNYRCCEPIIDMSYSIERYLDICQEYVGEENMLYFVFGVSFIISLLFYLVWKLVAGGKVKRRGILFVGLSGAGKTYLLSKILTGQVIETVTSLKENQATYASEKGVLNIIDIPGQEAIRQKFFDQFKDTAKGIIFLIDSESFSKDLKDVAEYLFTILTDQNVLKFVPPLLIACNKQDLLTSKSKKVIQDHLEKELNTVRKTRSAALSSIDGEEATVHLGVKGKPFEFSHLGKLKVDFIECNAKGDSENESRLDELLLWLNRQA
uniref:signal recognition particle receptor subunit beta-like n=1 Tax=Styela clava TaxID=7725 RepID=UPI0019396CE8|nr:signal recognition particle receptor subunit beta-like [Styela clava]